MQGSPGCMFNAVSSACHFAVGTMIRFRFLHTPTWELSSAASLAQPFRAAMAFSQRRCKTHVQKVGVNVSVLSIQHVSVLPVCSRLPLLGKQSHSVLLRGMGTPASENIVFVDFLNVLVLDLVVQCFSICWFCYYVCEDLWVEHMWRMLQGVSSVRPLSVLATVSSGLRHICVPSKDPHGSSLQQLHLHNMPSCEDLRGVCWQQLI